MQQINEPFMFSVITYLTKLYKHTQNQGFDPTEFSARYIQKCNN